MEQIKELRVRIDGLAQLTKELKPVALYRITVDPYKENIEEATIGTFKSPSVNSKEIKKSVDSLYLAKAWLGKMLGELGTENPYGSGYKTIEDIVPTQDVAHQNLSDFLSDGNGGKDWKNKNHIEKVDYLRQEIQKIVEEITKWYTHTPTPTREFAIARTNCYNYLCEAKFWLGFELERVRNNEKDTTE